MASRKTAGIEIWKGMEKVEKLIVLGTGNAMVTKCYNTCFAIWDGTEYFMVDAGGGNGILAQLEKAKIDVAKIHHIFVTHEHTDHLLGMVWMVRKIGSMMLAEAYEGELRIYCHEDLVDTILTVCRLTMQKKFTNLFGGRILLCPVQDGETRKILDYDVTFFDIHSTKAKQYGFTLYLKNGKKFTCLGDEPFNERCKEVVEGSSWLLSEAFCLYGDRELFKPYEKHHSTVREACQLAEQLQVEHVVLWHTEDKHISERKALYTAEGAQYYHGDIFVPDDLEEIPLG